MIVSPPENPIYRIDPMLVDDVAEVSRVERRCFTNPWPISAYRRELQAPDQNYYVVLREQVEPTRADDPMPATNGHDGAVSHGESAARVLPRRTLLPIAFGRRNGAARNARREPPVIGFAGMWTVYDEAHVTTIAIEPESRGRGLGELLLVAMFQEATRRGANWLTLEVRASNEVAQRLYLKYGFTSHGRRKRYYSDNNEDALIMWSRALHDPGYQAELDRLQEALFARLGHIPAGLGRDLNQPRVIPRPSPPVMSRQLPGRER